MGIIKYKETMGAIKSFRQKTRYGKKMNSTDLCPTGSDTEPTTRSGTTPAAATGDAPSSTTERGGVSANAHFEDDQTRQRRREVACPRSLKGPRPHARYV